MRKGLALHLNRDPAGRSPRPIRTFAFVAAMPLALAGGPCGSANAIRTLGRGPVEYKTGEWRFMGVEGAELSTPHYVLRTTCKTDEFVRAIPAFLEDCWKAYAELLPPPRQPKAPLESYLFQSRWHWEQFTDRFAPARAATYRRIRQGGYSERGVTVSHYSTRAGTLSILAHEGLHQFLDATHGPAVPPWINEGLACYFEGFELDNERRPIFTPRANSLRINHLREAVAADGLIPLRDVLATHAGVEVHNRTGRVKTYYAQEWSLVLYLLESPLRNPYHDAFRRLLQDLGSDDMARKAAAFRAADTSGDMSFGEAVFRAYVTEDLDRFESDYRAFVQDLVGIEK